MASGEQPYGTDDVLRAFRSSGVDLDSERLNDDDRTCTSPTSIPAVSADGIEYSSVVIASGEEPTAPFPQMLPQVTLWNEPERRNWVIWLFDNEDQARDLVTNPPPSPLGQPLKVARAGNVVAIYLDGTDGPRLLGALAQLSEGEVQRSGIGSNSAATNNGLEHQHAFGRTSTRSGALHVAT